MRTIYVLHYTHVYTYVRTRWKMRRKIRGEISVLKFTNNFSNAPKTKAEICLYVISRAHIDMRMFRVISHLILNMVLYDTRKKFAPRMKVQYRFLKKKKKNFINLFSKFYERREAKKAALYFTQNTRLKQQNAQTSVFPFPWRVNRICTTFSVHCSARDDYVNLMKNLVRSRETMRHW